MADVKRKIKSTVVTTKCVNLDTMDVVDETFVLGNVKAEKVARVINSMLKDTNLKLVKIVDVSTDTAIFKMSESTFVKYAERVE